jgi:hypothetical protein
MKKLLMYITLAAAVFTSCNNDLETEGISRITYFPEFVMEGEDFYLIDEGVGFTDPGIKVLEQGEEIPFTVSYTGRYTGYSGTTIGTDPDEYSLNYSAVNQDGFAASQSRKIIVVHTGDLVTDISGAYISDPLRVNGVSYEPSIVMIWKIAPDVYEISCSVGGFYSDGRGDGDINRAKGGTITVNNLATNSFTFTPGHSDGFDSDITVTSLTVHPDTKTIDMTSFGDFTNGSWTNTLIQIQPN